MIANGHIYPELILARQQETFEMPRLFYWNLRNGAFRDLTKTSGAGLTVRRSSRGLAVGDLDGDGSPEIVISNMNAPPSVLKNFGERGKGLVVKLTGVKSNRGSIGAIVPVHAGGQTQTAVVTSGTSYLSQSDFRQYFGLGKLSQSDRIEVLWPSGQRDSINSARAGREIHIREGEGLVGSIEFVH